jgi:hypothetical protein
MTLVTPLVPLTQQGKVRSWILLGCREHLPPSPGVKYLHSANPYEAMSDLIAG